MVMLRYAIAVLTLALPLAMTGCTGNPTDGGVPPAKGTKNETAARGAKLPTEVVAALEGEDAFELLSLDPGPIREKSDGDFHGYKVLGKTLVKGAKDRERLVGALRKGVSEGDDGLAAGCFNPRHGIRSVQGAKTTDLVICFECLAAKVFIDGQHRSGFPTSASPQPAFDQVLRDAGIALPKAAER